MDNQFEEDERARSSRRAQKIEEMKREKEMQQRERFRKYLPIIGGAVCAVVVIGIGGSAIVRHGKNRPEQNQEAAQVQIQEDVSQTDGSQTEEGSVEYTDVAEEPSYEPFVTQATESTTAVDGEVLTVLVAAEHVENLDDTYTITLAETDYSFSHDCSNAGFDVDEKVTVRDLFYGTILPSGADAAVGLAAYVAGSHEAFVDMMNEKLDELGLSDTAHMTNCVGLYDENHYCSVYDMAIILKAAMDNPICREVMSAHTYNTSITTQHPEGILLSNWFLRRIEDKDCGGEVLCAKTGYVVQSGNCAASYALDQSGNGYLCVTAHSTSSWRCIYDHVALYQQFLN